MRFADVVATSTTVGATRSRNAKSAALRELLSAAGPEVPVVVAWLSGDIPQGRLGIGWRTLRDLQVPPVAASILTVEEVDATLTRLAGTTGTGSVAARAELLRGLFGRATDAEQGFLFRLLTGELRQGALTGVMVEAIIAVSGQPAALVRRAHMLTGSLPDTATLAIDGGAQALADVGLQVGRAVSPMLATPADGLDAALADLGPDLVVDHKLDGARIQVHRDGDDVAVFTRTLNDVTSRVPDLVAVVRELPLTSAILDGETLTLHDDGRPRPFQETMSRFGSMVHTDPDVADEPRLLRPFFFDCLHLDGEDLIDEPLAHRLDALDSVAAQLRITSQRHPTPEAAKAVLDAALAAGHEGVMVKSLTGPYAAGRRGKSWQKVKPVHTLDLVVLGAEWGSGRRTGYLSNLHLGARDPDGGDPVMVGKTFKGLTDALLRWQTEEFPRHEAHRDSHTVYLRPEIVVEIELDGVQRSSRYPGGVALRFARVLRYRPDKTAAEGDDIDTVRGLLR
ncbi:ATP-dependent DNA ligase [Gordonia sp. VNQ95]|uniref:ATP-dependent DNA ligase n=1 Tax=Gordonia sp. VNQ95 TaxID=3156619 RepID=UPI0032B59197